MVAVSEPDEAQGYFGCHEKIKTTKITSRLLLHSKSRFPF